MDTGPHGYDLFHYFRRCRTCKKKKKKFEDEQFFFEKFPKIPLGDLTLNLIHLKIVLCLLSTVTNNAEYSGTHLDAFLHLNNRQGIKTPGDGNFLGVFSNYDPAAVGKRHCD